MSALQEALSGAGGGLVIEKALPMGAIPLKRIAVAAEKAMAVESAPLLRKPTIR